MSDALLLQRLAEAEHISPALRAEIAALKRLLEIQSEEANHLREHQDFRHQVVDGLWQQACLGAFGALATYDATWEQISESAIGAAEALIKKLHERVNQEKP